MRRIVVRSVEEYDDVGVVIEQVTEVHRANYAIDDVNGLWVFRLDRLLVCTDGVPHVVRSQKWILFQSIEEPLMVSVVVLLRVLARFLASKGALHPRSAIDVPELLILAQGSSDRGATAAWHSNDKDSHG